MKVRKEERKKERKEEIKKEKERKNISINAICYIKTSYEHIYDNFILEIVTCEMITSS
jgi:hypothetical protein